jgi:plastocyanin
MRVGSLLPALSLLILCGGDARRTGKQSVAIKDMSFQPPEIEVRVGETVTWTNTDDRDHSVVAADGSFNSNNLSTGARFSYRFSKAGKYAYSCSYHPRMKGTVSVLE